MSVSTLPSAGGLDVQELSQKLSSISTLEAEGEKGKEGLLREESETSSTAAIFGSEGGMFVRGEGGWSEAIGWKSGKSGGREVLEGGAEVVEVLEGSRYASACYCTRVYVVVL